MGFPARDCRMAMCRDTVGFPFFLPIASLGQGTWLVLDRPESAPSPRRRTRTRLGSARVRGSDGSGTLHRGPHAGRPGRPRLAFAPWCCPLVLTGPCKFCTEWAGLRVISFIHKNREKRQCTACTAKEASMYTYVPSRSSEVYSCSIKEQRMYRTPR